jgi:DNA-binding NarL/FixJ family response regulator
VAIEVLIADGQTMVRTGFRIILEREPDIEVVAEAPDGPAVLDAAARLRPDVCLLDIGLPGLDGIEAARRLTGRGAREHGVREHGVREYGGRRVAVPDQAPRVVLITTSDEERLVHAALDAGACGFLLKDAPPALLVEAVRSAAAGDALISPSVTVRLLRELAAGPPPPGRGDGPALSDRELEVVRRAARGATNNEIAAAMHLAPSTVKTHLARVQAKIDARNRVEIAAWAWQRGLMNVRRP